MNGAPGTAARYGPWPVAAVALLGAEAVVLRYARWWAIDAAGALPDPALRALVAQRALLEGLLFAGLAVAAWVLGGAHRWRARRRPCPGPLLVNVLCVAALLVALRALPGAETSRWLSGGALHHLTLTLLLGGAWLAAAGSGLLLLAPARCWSVLLRRHTAAVIIGAALLVLYILLQSLLPPFERLWSAALLGPTVRCATWFGGLLGLPLVGMADPADFGTAAFAVHIGPTCLGYQGVGILSVALLSYCLARRQRLRLSRVWLVLAAAAAVLLLFNALRIAALVLIGSRWSPQIAVIGFHSTAGWLELMLTLAIAVRVVERWGTRSAAGGGISGAAPAVPPALVPLAAVTAAAFAGALLRGAADWGYPLRVGVGLAVLARYRRQLPAPPVAVDTAAVLAGGAVFLVWLRLVPFDPGGSAETGAALAAVSPVLSGAWLLLRLLGAVVVAPLVEEWAFRGWLLPQLLLRLQRLPPWAARSGACAISAALFGALHGQWLAATVAGLVYGAVYLRRRCLGHAAAAHATTNLLLGLYVLLTERWSYW